MALGNFSDQRKLMFHLFTSEDDRPVGTAPFTSVECAAEWLWTFWRAAGGDNSKLHEKFDPDTYVIRGDNGSEWRANRDLTFDLTRDANPVPVEDEVADADDSGQTVGPDSSEG